MFQTPVWAEWKHSQKHIREIFFSTSADSEIKWSQGGGKVSKSHGHATAQKISDFAQNLEICMRNLKKYAFNLFYSFFSLCFTHIRDFQWYFSTFTCAKSQNLCFDRAIICLGGLGVNYIMIAFYCSFKVRRCFGFYEFQLEEISFIFGSLAMIFLLLISLAQHREEIFLIVTFLYIFGYPLCDLDHSLK